MTNDLKNFLEEAKKDFLSLHYGKNIVMKLRTTLAVITGLFAIFTVINPYINMKEVIQVSMILFVLSHCPFFTFKFKWNEHELAKDTNSYSIWEILKLRKQKPYLVQKIIFSLF